METHDSVLVYGLSTEGYMISNSLVSKSISTTILDEKLHVATEITPQILSEYSSAQSIIEGEALFSIQPEKTPSVKILLFSLLLKFAKVTIIRKKYFH